MTWKNTLLLLVVVVAFHFLVLFGAGLWSMWRPLPLVQRAAPPWSIWWLPLGASDGSPFNRPLDQAFKLNAPILGVRNPNPQSKQQATLPRSLSVGWGSEPPLAGSGCSAARGVQLLNSLILGVRNPNPQDRAFKLRARSWGFGIPTHK